jgi:hypothetical protein
MAEPVVTLSEDVRWVEQCIHGKDIHEACRKCNDLTVQGREMFAPCKAEDD